MLGESVWLLNGNSWQSSPCAALSSRFWYVSLLLQRNLTMIAKADTVAKMPTAITPVNHRYGYIYWTKYIHKTHWYMFITCLLVQMFRILQDCSIIFLAHGQCSDSSVYLQPPVAAYYNQSHHSSVRIIKFCTWKSELTRWKETLDAILLSTD